MDNVEYLLKTKSDGLKDLKGEFIQLKIRGGFKALRKIIFD